MDKWIDRSIDHIFPAHFPRHGHHPSQGLRTALGSEESQRICDELGVGLKMSPVLQVGCGSCCQLFFGSLFTLW